jgi:Cu+-exporting ATPase
VTAPQAVTDPVCGMSIEPTTAAAHDGHTYHFCSENCHDTFIADPNHYVASTADHAHH